MTEGRPNDWANAQAGPYSIEGRSHQQAPVGPPGPYAAAQQPPNAPSQPFGSPYSSPYAPPQPYGSPYAPPQPIQPYGSPYAPPQPTQPYGSPDSSPYAPAYSAPLTPYSSPHQQPYNPGLGYQQPQAYGYMPFMKRPEAPSANTAMVLGIISLAVGLLLCTPVGLLGIAAVITGNSAKREIRESRNYLNGQGKVTTALITGWIAIVVGAIGVLLLIVLLTDSDFTSTL